MTHTYSNIVLSKLSVDAYPIMSNRVSLIFVTHLHVEAISLLKKQLQKFCKVVSTGRHYAKMCTNSVQVAIDAKGWEVYQKRT